jgi:hypothetical protein
MVPWEKLLHLGDISMTLAAAAAITAWLVAARAWRMAFWWSLLFAVGIGVVGASKIAFLAWGNALPALNFKAASGHAAGVTAVFPTLLYLLFRRSGWRVRATAAAAGLAAGALMGVLLVVLGQHSAAEAAAGWALGAMVGLGAIWMAGELPPRPAYALLCSSIVFVTAACLMRSVPVGWLMFRTARILSAHSALFPWG